MFHLSVPQLVFDEVQRQGLGLGDWTTVLFSDRAGSIRTAEDYSIGEVLGPAAAEQADVVVVPSWFEDGRTAGPALQRTLTKAHGRGATIAGLCLGAVAVADAGLLSRRAAVTHWQAVDMLAARHRDIDVDASVLYIDHGDVLTSAGTASAVDACLHLVAQQARRGGSQPSRTQPRGGPAPRGRAGAIHRTAATPAVGERSDRRRARVGVATPGRTPTGRTACRRRAPEPTHLHPGVPSFYRGHPSCLGQASAPRRGPPTAGVDGPADRPSRRHLRFRQHSHHAAALRRSLRHLAVRIPPTVQHPYRRQHRLSP